MEFKLLDPPHNDTVNDIAFDYYGKRFATCSADKSIKIWKLVDEEKGIWKSDELSKQHTGAILRIAWAHPEFGQLLASCSEDNTIKIWEEQEGSSSTAPTNVLGCAAVNEPSTKWTKKATLSLSRKSVNDVKFSHRSLGLKLASVSADGFIRIYEARDVFELSNWEVLAEYQVEDTSISMDGSNASSYLRSNQVPSSAAALNSSSSSSALAAASNSSVNPGNASNAANSVSNSNGSNTSSSNTTSNVISSAGTGGANANQNHKKYASEHGLTCVSWNDCQFEPARLVVGGYSRKAIIFRLEGSNLVEEFTLGQHNNAISDVAWAPDMGRSFHLIATASREATFKIHQLKRCENGDLKFESTTTLEHPSKNKASIWRLSWNATGTVLAASAEDGTISLWRRDFSGEWKNVQNIPSENSMSYFYTNS